MAATQSQWFAKLKSFVPSWYFENQQRQLAHMQALAGVLAQLESDLGDHFQETLILGSSGEFLDQHGEERSLSRLAVGEYDPQFSVRVQSLANQSNLKAIKKLLDLLLMVGESTIIEDTEVNVFANRDSYCGRGALIIEAIENTFSVIVERQVHDPYSFVGREYFAGRGEYIGQAESSQYVFDLLLETVSELKAAGVLYRIIEKLE